MRWNDELIVDSVFILPAYVWTECMTKRAKAMIIITTKWVGGFGMPEDPQNM